MKKILITYFSIILILFISAASINRVNDLHKTSIKYKTFPKEMLVLADTTKRERDILKDILAINSPDSPKPPTDFRKGHVTEANLSDYFKKTEYGYIIDLKKQTNVPSPSFHKGKIFVSGGFGSKQYYAFDAKTGEKVWAVNLDDDGPSAAAIENDIIVFNTESCTIFACDVKTGKQIWSYWLGDPLMSMPTVANGKVFTAYPASYGFSNGKRGYYNNNNINNNINQNNIPIQQNIEPKIVEKKHKKKDKIKIKKTSIHPTHVLACFDLKTGKILWQKWIDSDVMSAPVAEGNNLYVTTFSGSLYKFQQKDGKILSAKAVRATSAPVIKDGEVFITKRSDDKGEKVAESIASLNKEYKVNKQYRKKEAVYLDKNVQDRSSLKTQSLNEDAGNGFGAGAPASANWTGAYNNIGYSNVSSLQAFQGSRVLNHNGWNYNTMGDELVCTNPKNGKERWKVKLDGDLKSAGGFMGTPPVIVNHYIIIATYTGDILVIDEKSGQVKQKYETKENIRYQPIVSEGWIYATTTKGKLIAINTKNKKLTGWNMWGANAARTNKL